MTSPEIEPRRLTLEPMPASPGPNVVAHDGTRMTVENRSVEQELANLARLIDRADAEASRLRARRLVAWRAARDAGLSWRAIAAASGGMDHAGIAKTVKREQEGTD